MTLPVETFVDAMKAAGEPTRLRILSLLRHGDLAVGELVQILDQSQPRLSHHLKTLALAGLVERLPEGSWVFYRAASRGWARKLLDHIFQDVPLQSDQFAADAETLAAVRQKRTESAKTYFAEIAAQWDEVRTRHYPNADIEGGLLQAAGAGPFGRIIDLGTGTARILMLLAPLAREAEGLDQSHQMLTVARDNLAQAGITNATVRQGDVASTPFETGSADLVVIHQVLHFVEDPARVISEAARLLTPGGKLLIVDFAPHTLEFLREDHGHRRLGIRDQDMNDWVRLAGLSFQEQRRFTPPASLEAGLAVNIWSAQRPARPQEAAA